MTKRLRGWARLAIVVSLIWTFVVGWIAVTTLPKSPNAVVAYSSDATVYDPETKKAVTMMEAARLGRQRRGDVATGEPSLSDNELREIANDSSVTPLELSKLSASESDRLLNIVARDLGASRRSHYQRAFVFWIAPLLAMYLVGGATRWVYRGFTSPAP